MSKAGFANADKIQSVINDDLFPSVQNVADIKQVLEFMERVAAPLSEDQLRAIILLEALGTNTRLHGAKNPYKPIIDKIGGEFRKNVAKTEVFLRTIEELVPKPPKPVILADGGGREVSKGGRR